MLFLKYSPTIHRSWRKKIYKENTVELYLIKQQYDQNSGIPLYLVKIYNNITP